VTGFLVAHQHGISHKWLKAFKLYVNKKRQKKLGNVFNFSVMASDDIQNYPLENDNIIHTEIT